jgi:hypothetical protein
MQSVIKFFKAIGNFIYALFFTRDDDLDVLQLMFAVILAIATAVVWNLTNTVGMSDTVIIESLVTLRWMIGLLVVTAVPKWLVPYMVEKISPKKSINEETTEEH